jgi:hypothetical protein
VISKRFVLLSGLALVGGLSAVAYAENPLVGEIRRLRDSLPLTDAARPALTLRLADTLCNEALHARIDEESKGVPVSADLRRTEEEALGLYETALRGDEGTHKKPAGEAALKISFQRARLMQELGQTKPALEIYRTVGAQSESAALKRESFMRIAEIVEHQNPKSPEVEAAYRKTLEYCQGTDTCSYAHYRLAWFYRAQGDSALPKAIAEVKLSLFDSKGAIREEALRDWVTFVSQAGGDGQAAMTEFDEFARAKGRPNLLDQLGAAYFSNGNRVAGIRILAFTHARNPRLLSGLKLIEESLGQRDWPAIDRLTHEASTALLGQAANFTDSDRKDAEKILKRVSVQLDQDKNQDARIKTAFQSIVDLDLALFPKSPDRAKMMEGWLASEDSYAAKAAKTEGWIASPAFALTPAEKTHFREILLFAAQKAKAYPEIVKQTQALEAIATAGGNTAKAREYRYLRAHAHYDAKKNDLALPLFQDLARVTTVKDADTYAVKSQNLALDILNQEKRYGDLTAQASAWTGNSALAKNTALASEITEMAKVSNQAEFQTYTAMGAKPEALAYFLAQCKAGKFRPQSCENSKVLSVQLKDQTALIDTLRIVGTPAELASELEAAGYYAESAKIREKAAKTIQQYLRVALFYELAGDEASRTRVLATLLKTPLVKKPFPDEENALLVMVRDTKFFQPSLLALRWSPKAKASIADALEAGGHSTPATRKIVAQSTENTGPGWESVRLAEFRKLWEKQHGISFYGRNGKRKLTQRMALLKRLSTEGEKTIERSSERLRFVILNALQRAYAEVSTEITASPIPDGLEPAQVEALKHSLAELAAPFMAKAKGYGDLYQTELGKAKVPTDATFGRKLASTPDVSLESPSVDETPSTSVARAALNADSVNQALLSLRKAPEDAVALQHLQDLYRSAGSPRLAAYYEGRLLALRKEGKKP